MCRFLVADGWDILPTIDVTIASVQYIFGGSHLRQTPGIVVLCDNKTTDLKLVAVKRNPADVWYYELTPPVVSSMGLFKSIFPTFCFLSDVCPFLFFSQSTSALHLM